MKIEDIEIKKDERFKTYEYNKISEWTDDMLDTNLTCLHKIKKRNKKDCISSSISFLICLVISAITLNYFTIVGLIPLLITVLPFAGIISSFCKICRNNSEIKKFKKEYNRRLKENCTIPNISLDYDSNINFIMEEKSEKEIKEELEKQTKEVPIDF